MSAGMLTTSVVVAVPASADPICAKGMKDQGVTRTKVVTGPAVTYVEYTGTYFNCSGGTGADKRKIRVDLGHDSPCITVRYRSAGDARTIGPLGSHNPRWVSC